MLTLEDIERRAKARGWYVAWFLGHNGAARLRVRTSEAHYADWMRDALGGDAFCVFAGVPPAHKDYLEGRVTEAREGAARVLAVVAQVAAMQWAWDKGRVGRLP